MNVALYARVSTKNQEQQGTIASQIEALRSYAKTQDFEVAEDYVCQDEGYSGALLARPGLDRLRDGAQAGVFDAILVLSPDRLSRKYAYLILILEEFERFGVRVTFLEQPPADDPHTALLVQIQGAVAEYERTKMAERYRRGKLYRARQGEIFWNSIPYGYRHVPRRDGVPAHLVIDDAQAELVRKIFAWHAYEGMTIRQLTKQLTREGYPTPKGGARWGETTVHRILRREAYLGTLYYNQSVWVSVPVSEGHSGRRKKGLRPSSEWIAISIPPLVDRETFERSQARHGPNQQFSPRNLHQERWLLRRLVRCEKCGLKCACVAPRTPSVPYYRCEKQERVTGRARCRPNHIRAEPLDELVWQEIRRHLLEPELLLRAQASLARTESLDQSFLSAQLDHIRKRLTQVKAERRRLLDVYQGGFLDKDEFESRTSQVAGRIGQLQADLESLELESQYASASQGFSRRLRDFTSAITQRLDTMTFHERQTLVRSVLEEVVISDNVVKLYLKIPVPKPNPDPPATPKPCVDQSMSTQFDLRSRAGHRWCLRCPRGRGANFTKLGCSVLRTSPPRNARRVPVCYPDFRNSS
ncbi:MAG: recombinase family protein [Gammaproteobacteria bacterium]